MRNSSAGDGRKALVAVVLGGLVSLACGSYAPRVEEQVISTATPLSAVEAAQTAPPTATLLPVSHLGDVVEMDGYSLSAVTVEDPPTGPLGVFYEPQPGMRPLAVEIIVGNVNGERFDSNPLYATLVDTDGFLYGAESSVLGANSMEMLEVTPGERVRGRVSFIVPEGAQPAALKYEFNRSVLQVGLSPR